MSLRIALLAGVLALAGTALRAEELQWTVTGDACPASDPLCSASTPMPFTVRYDLNTLGATLTRTFGPNPITGAPPGNVVVNFSSSFAVTNYLATVGGQTVDFAAQTTGSFGFSPPNFGTTFESGGGAGGFGFDDNETFAGPFITEAQYTASNDPLAFTLLLFRGGQCPSAGNPCHLLGGGPFIQDAWALEPATMSITPVPAPGPLLLFLAGLVGLIPSRGRKRLGFLLLRS